MARANERLVLDTPTGALRGTLVVPEGKGPFPVVLIVAGSGPTDRDGNNPLLPGKNDAYKLLAAALAQHGVASLRYDKRGIGSSVTTSERDLRFQSYVDDALAWIKLLRSDSRFRGVFIAGHSEGSLVGMLAAERSAVDGYASLAGAGRPAPSMLGEQLAAQLSGDALARAQQIVAQLASGRTVEQVPADLQVLFRPSVQPYLISWFRYDPAAEIKRLTCPIAIVQGDRDLQVSVRDAQLLAKSAPQANLKVVAGMNHVLKHVESTAQEAQLVSYTDPMLPIEPAVVDAIVTLVKHAPGG